MERGERTGLSPGRRWKKAGGFRYGAQAQRSRVETGPPSLECRLAGNECFFCCTWAGQDDLVSADQLALIGSGSCPGAPSAQGEGQRPVGKDPLSVVLPSDVEVGAGGDTAFARRMADSVAALHDVPSRHAAFICQVQVDHHPPGLLK